MIVSLVEFNENNLFSSRDIIIGQTIINFDSW
jgi:hypothetical protein